MHAAEPLPHFVDDYLSLPLRGAPHRRNDGWGPCPRRPDRRLTGARRSTRTSSALAGLRAAGSTAFPSTASPTLEQIEHQIVSSNIRARQFELEAVRSWERNPHVYADTLASSLAAQAIFTYAPETERARRVLSKLRQVPRLVQAARDNIKEPPAIFVKVGIDTWRGAMTFIDADLPRAFRQRRRPAPARRPRRRVRRSGADDRRLRRPISKTTSARRPRARSASGAIASSRSCGSRKASRCRSIACWRSPRASSQATQEEFRQAGRPAERRRSDRGVAQGEAEASRAGHADRDRARAARRAAHVPVAQPVVSMPDERRHHRRRRRRSSSAGRRRACGRPARSNRSRRARCIT